MKHLLQFLCAALPFVTCLVVASPRPISAAPTGPQSTPSTTAAELPIPVAGTSEASLHSTAALGAREQAEALARAATDTFFLYGGPGSLEGKFEDAAGQADWQDWTGVDFTETPVYWQVSTFNAENLNANGAGNRALWCGQSADQVEDWSTPPGYGNQWWAIALYESEPLADTSVGQVVDLDFVFNHDTEPGYDFFVVEYERSGIWTTVLELDGSNRAGGVFAAPGVVFSSVATAPIEYSGNDYTPDGRIRIRFRVYTDVAWSDEDGLWESSGAVQIDDIVLTTSQGTFTEDYEGEGPYLFAPQRQPFFGDFSDVYPSFQEDLDPCRSNSTPVIGFIDYGQEVRNGPGVFGHTSTGGSTWSEWSYGIPGGYVLNWTGGLSGVVEDMDNAVVSPPIEWDLSGPEDDGPDVAGAFLRFTRWAHLPLTDGFFFYRWQVRSRAEGQPWSGWLDRGFIYTGGSMPNWGTHSEDVTDLLVADPAQVQIALKAGSLTFYPGPVPGATPSPVFDNVTFAKYRIGGPSITTRSIDLAQDAFPRNGTIAASTPSERDALDVRFDMARDINTAGSAIVAGDSVIVDVKAMIPGTTVSDVRMKWALRRNSFFEESIRSAPARAVDADVVTSGEVWTGAVLGQISTNSVGTPVPGRWFFDLPDEDFLYPGDQLHVHIEATDNDGRVSTLPASTAGFGVWNGKGESTYDRDFVVRALPSITEEGQPPLLVVYDARDGEREELHSMMRQLGSIEGIDHDVFTVRGPSSGVSNGIGSAGAHGATADQLAGYSVILYLTGENSTWGLSDGTGRFAGDKSDDTGTLSAWKALPGARHTVYFGDGLVSGTAAQNAPDATYVSSILGVDLLGPDVRASIDGQWAPRVDGALAEFATGFAAYGGCPQPNSFDAIAPLPPAEAGHTFLDLGGSPYGTVAASVVHDRLDGLGDRKVDITFPFALASVFERMNAPGTAVSARTNLLAEVLAYLGAPPPGGVPTSAPGILRSSLRAVPNPFNPRTQIVLTLERTTDLRLEVFDLRGARVTTLHRGELGAGDHQFRWTGSDAQGQAVASGVYLVRAIGPGVDLRSKIALLR